MDSSLPDVTFYEWQLEDVAFVTDRLLVRIDRRESPPSRWWAIQERMADMDFTGESFQSWLQIEAYPFMRRALVDMAVDNPPPDWLKDLFLKHHGVGFVALCRLLSGNWTHGSELLARHGVVKIVPLAIQSPEEWIYARARAVEDSRIGPLSPDGSLAGMA